MTENEIDNEIEIIESEAVPESNQQEKTVEVIKKSSFLTFFAFILSVLALAMSGYQYYLQQKDTSDSKQAWQTPLMNAEKKTTEKFNALSTQIKQIRETNLGLQQQLKTIEKIATKLQVTNTVVPVDKVEKFDDTTLNKQILQIEDKLTLQDNLYKQLQTNIESLGNKQTQDLQKVRNDITSQQPVQITTTKTSRNKYLYDMTESLLQAAHIQLNVNNNPKSTIDLLTKAHNKLLKLKEPQYTNLGTDINSLIAKITNSIIPEIHLLSQQIDVLSMATAKLPFSDNANTKSQPEKAESSWYDKLIVIRKIEDTKQIRLTNAEQQDIFYRLKNHYGMLKTALINRNQVLWTSGIDQIEKILMLNFAETSKNISSELSELKSIELNPVFPDLNIYLQKFNAMRDVSTEPSEND